MAHVRGGATWRAALFAAASALGAGGCSRGSHDEVPPVVALTPAFGGQAFHYAVDLLQHPSDDHRWYVVEQFGAIETFLDTDPAGTRTTAVTVPNLMTNGENGVLGMAFDPAFGTNGQVFISYVENVGGNAGTSKVARYVSADGGLTFTLDPGPDATVLSLLQPFTNHNGGDVDFGPDGFLYIAFGDGGDAGDPFGNGQDVNTWLGKILRLDVSVRPYAVPPDNPFVGVTGDDEIWAYGLRNPWKMGFDPATGKLWAGDVGQDAAEEIDEIVRGGNYGWNLEEGNRAYPSGKPSHLPGLVAPVAVHNHPQCEAIVGGFVYHGTRVPEISGRYVYGDFEQGRLFCFDPNGQPPVPRQIHKSPLNIVAFGQGRDGELYVVTYDNGGVVYSIDPLP
ncbi:MAG TPA: PQQ-dependent sugar dehydrogenase [Planctomycetota bacterium]|jgi:glucose/arabinose dehydrogenase|nr:PQQ-dependent sugar dehydrogenase [Planctomycetota bacterium]